VKFRSIGTIIAAFAAVAIFAPTARANDYSSKARQGTGPMAIKSASDQVGEQTVTYRVETYGAYDNVRDFSIMRWYFDLNGDGKYSDMCIRLESVGDGRLRASFYPKCGGFAWSTAEAQKPAPNIVQFSLLLRDLINGGGVVPGKPLSYRVEAEDNFGHTDWIPERGLISQTTLPHLSAPELEGRVAGPGEKPAQEAKPEGNGDKGVAGFFSHRFAALGGLPVAWLFLLTLLIVVAAWGVWGRISRRFLSEPRPQGTNADRVHDHDT